MRKKCDESELSLFSWALYMIMFYGQCEYNAWTGTIFRKNILTNWETIIYQQDEGGNDVLSVSVWYLNLPFA